MSGPDFWPKSYAKPAEDVGDIPSIDNTVKVGHMRPDGTIEFTSVMSAFPTEEERKAKDRSTGHIAESRPRVRIQRVDWDEIWPSIVARLRDNPAIDAQTLAGHYGVPYLELHIRMAEWKKQNAKGDDVLTEKKRLTKYTQEERLDLARQIKDKVAMGYTKLGAAKEMGIAPGNADRWLKELAKVEADEYDKQVALELAKDKAILESVDEGKREAVEAQDYAPEPEYVWDGGDINQYVAGLLGCNGKKDEEGRKFLQDLGDGIKGEYSQFIDNTVKVGRMNADGMIEFTSLDDMKLEWIQDTFGLRMPSNERLAIIQQIAAIGG